MATMKEMMDAHRAFCASMARDDMGEDIKTNPPVSQAQARFMRAVASGKIKKKGLSKREAGEYVSGHPTKGLPERAGR